MSETEPDLDDQPSDHNWHHKYPQPPSLAELGLEEADTQQKRKSGKALTKLKKFRFQLFHEWLTQQFKPCRVADIGGGKGLLAYLLQQSGWDATVVDPHAQSLPTKYKDLNTDRRVLISPEERVPRLSQPFEPTMAKSFDLLIGMHAHGCNMHIINAAKTYGCQFVLLPCCVIDEPATPTPDMHWFSWLADYGKKQTFDVQYFKLNFKGQNVGMYSTP